MQNNSTSSVYRLALDISSRPAEIDEVGSACMAAGCTCGTWRVGVCPLADSAVWSLLDWAPDVVTISVCRCIWMPTPWQHRKRSKKPRFGQVRFYRKNGMLIRKDIFLWEQLYLYDMFFVIQYIFMSKKYDCILYPFIISSHPTSERSKFKSNACVMRA